MYTYACATITIEPDFPAACRCTPYSGGALADFLTTDCTSTSFNHSFGFVASPQCVGGGALSQSEKPLGCWLRDNWPPLVVANGVPGESARLIFEAGSSSVSFSLGGLLCMSKWFNLDQSYPSSGLDGVFNVDGAYPGCAGTPPDLSKMGGSTLLTVVGAKLNMLRDSVLQRGEGVGVCVGGGGEC